MDKNKIKKKIYDYLISLDEISFAYLFGSFVEKEKYRIIDIAVYLKDDFNYKDFTKYPFGYQSAILGKLSLELKTDKIDLVILNEADILLFQKIITSGELLFERDKSLRVHVTNSIRKEYIDTIPYRNLKFKTIKKKLNAR